MLSSYIVYLASATSVVTALGCSRPIVVDECPPPYSSAPIPPGFVSFSIEFAFFPDYAGNTSNPNVFSKNLLGNLGGIQGSMPYVRVGGNTQDYAIFQPDQGPATVGQYTSASLDYPSILTIGPSFFESFSTWPGVKYIYGFNLGKNTSAARVSLLETVTIACQTLGKEKLAFWELGNEPDDYNKTIRPPTWHEPQYVAEWLNGSRAIKTQLAQSCPDLNTPEYYGYIGPSFTSTIKELDPIKAWADGFDTDGDVKLMSWHNYIGGADSPGITLQGTLMNHTSTVNSLAPELNASRHLAYTGVPYILGETNSLFHQGAPGLSNAFGAALWGLDYNLWCASQGIQRVHMHQGTDYRYASWQPITTNKTTIQTKTPYYGNIAVATMLGNLTAGNVQIANIPLESEFEAAYAAYVNGSLARLAIINMVEYNATKTIPRSSAAYSFYVPDGCSDTVDVLRLTASGSNATEGVTFNGVSYDYDLSNGKPVVVDAEAHGEQVQVQYGTLTIGVPDSSAVILSFT